jgi:hypothetical protein
VVSKGAADEAVLNIVHKKNNKKKSPFNKCHVIGYGGSLKGRKQPNFNISKLINNLEKTNRLLKKLKN